MISAVLSVLDLWVTSVIPHFIVAIFMTFCFIFTAFFLLQDLYCCSTSQEPNSSLKGSTGSVKLWDTKLQPAEKTAVSTFYVYVVFLVCYLPVYCVYISYIVSDKQNSTLVNPELYVRSLVFFNSSLNPVIYCWKMRHIRNEIQNIMRLNCCRQGFKSYVISKKSYYLTIFVHN